MASVNANAKMRIIELPLLQLVMAVEAILRSMPFQRLRSDRLAPCSKLLHLTWVFAAW